MTIYRRHVPNYVTIITSLSHFDHVFKMAEMADEYLSDEECGLVSNTKGKASSKGAAKYRTKFNTEWKVHFQLNVFGAITKD